MSHLVNHIASQKFKRFKSIEESNTKCDELILPKRNVLEIDTVISGKNQVFTFDQITPGVANVSPRAGQRPLASSWAASMAQLNMTERSESSSPGKDEENAVAQEKITEVVQGPKNRVRSAKRKKSGQSRSSSNGTKKQKRVVKKDKADTIQIPDSSTGIQKTAEEIEDFSSGWLARKVLISMRIELREKGIDAPSEATEKIKAIAKSVKTVTWSSLMKCRTRRITAGWKRSHSSAQTPFFDPKTVKGQDIVDAAKTGNKGYEDFDEQKNKFLYEEDTGIVEEEKCFFAGRGFKPEKSKGYVPVPKFHIKDDTEESGNQLQEEVLGTSMCLIKGIKADEETLSLET
ncbi:hypothetical protein L5515_009531 [Caenorhabditis briggsae]|uniref:Uncharacterized protein n=1 Tax=Caenorhabditis briggsae TaxID=6238 RepID=A0AAE9F8Z3_CAEBR|nr:hypothetical protein L5515_009531 [Caenorhabditis briggsae]